MKITVFCSANEHIDPEYFRLTEELGKWMAITTLYSEEPTKD